MNGNNEQEREFGELLESLCENRMTHEQSMRLEKLLSANATARQRYLEYIDLHGTLYWDTAKGVDFELPVDQFPHEQLTRVAESTDVVFTAGARQRRSSKTLVMAVLSVCLVLSAAVFIPNWWTSRNAEDLASQPSGDSSAANLQTNELLTNDETNNPASRISNGHVRKPFPRKPIQLPLINQPALVNQPGHGPEKQNAPATNAVSNGDPKQPSGLAVGSSSPVVVGFINEQVLAGWEIAGVQPSEIADDAEWVRRVYLDLVGHIPPPAAVEKFLEDRSRQKRFRLVDRLLDDADYVRQQTTIWTNLLIGRSSSRNVNRASLQRFLRNDFARNRPWNEMVFDLVSAEGEAQSNGAANFLLAHLNNQAVPATAITARLFLGIQVQCTQCHHHPFNDWQQNQFWELNSFFQRTKVVRRTTRDPKTGMRTRHTELVSGGGGGPTFYETRQGIMKAVLPRFEGQRIDLNPEVNLRRELATRMTQGDSPLLARAMVNRMWSHFFGVGFTKPIDDMGPHNSPTHPALLDRLSVEFVSSGFDIKQLTRWICNSQPYQLTSRLGRKNQADNPGRGETPLFSRMYVKPMTPEQLYDSILMATQAHHAGQSNWNDVVRQRQKWLQQFVIAYQNEENDEAITFDGSIPQALLMMNSELVQKAVGGASGTFFQKVASKRISTDEKTRKLCLSALSRYPSKNELAAIQKLLRKRTAVTPRDKNRRELAMIDGLRDVFWAYLNSNEFILVH